MAIPLSIPFARAARGLLATALVTALAVTALPEAAHAVVPSGFSEAVVASPTAPTAMELAPDGRIFVSEQAGALRVIKNGAMLPQPFLTLDVDARSERGLLGIAFDPDFAANSYLYLYYTAPAPTPHNRVSRFTANGDQAVPGSEKIILELPTLGTALVHNGGDIHFGPDGKLYIPVGDNASSVKAQQLTSPLGKILRINADGTIPPDNPFYGQTTGINRAIWALGLRNPFTAAFQPGTGRYFINDVGLDTWEEINEGQAGANYGWPTVEGPSTDTRFTTPLFAYQHDGDIATTGCAITGGVFYNPKTAQFPGQYVGKYFFGDYCSSWIRQLNPGNAAVQPFGTKFRFVIDLAVSDDGYMWVLTRADKNPAAVTRISYDAAVAPMVTSDPQPQTVAIGDPVSFTVSASGTAPLAYQWQRDGADIPGATSQTYTIPSASLADDNARFRVRVSNSLGTDVSAEALLRVIDNDHPVAVIGQPPSGAKYVAGQTISYSGTGTDTEDGTLPPPAFTWEVVFHHEDHVHPFLGPVSGQTSGSFEIPRTGEMSADVFYRIHLTVKDSAGLTHHVTRDILPTTVDFTLATSPAGLRLTLDGQPLTAPAMIRGVAGTQRELTALSPQDAQGKVWEFAAWSDGGTATHTVTLPEVPVTYTAAYIESAGITYRSSASDSSPEGRSSITIGKPPGTAPGDLMVASIVVNDHDPGLATPAGWTLVRQDAISFKLRQAVYTRVAGASEPATYTWSLTADFRRLAGGISSYLGADPGNPVDVSAALADSTADTEIEAPALVTTVPGTRLVYLNAVNGEGGVTPAADTAERYDVTSPNLDLPRDALAEAADVAQPAAGPATARTATAAQAGVHIASVLALRPASGTPGISFVASASSGSAAGRIAMAIQRPAGTASGDVMVASVVVNSDDSAITAPAGWTEVRQAAIPGQLRHLVYVRVAGGAEPASYTWNSALARRVAGGISTYRGVSTASPVDASGVLADATADTSIDAPSITTTVAGTRLIHLAGVNAEGGVTPPGGTERYEASSPNADLPRDALAEASDVTQPSAGGTGIRTATSASSGVHIGIHVALRPA
ncbi:PQQ-dependent sugar dehydrogenase [Longispora albida]|uniref:PQQ-dependent sugar dehydrogenase n=1 Tax=Longispora albida TaxID=203523 RepID=UPI00037AB667|nr:PQQ-dependent sugar dehydrogenase [Longispora albida]